MKGNELLQTDHTQTCSITRGYNNIIDESYGLLPLGSQLHHLI
jgi:hypothetical protein